MLDTIHKFSEGIDPEQMLMFLSDKVHFSLCLESFGDDIYMKMNARGIPLTQWENYKGKIAEEIKNEIKRDNCKDAFTEEIGINELRESWNKGVEELSNLFFVVMDKRLPDNAFFALFLRLSGLDVFNNNFNWNDELPYVPFADCRDKWKSDNHKHFISGIRQFLAMGKWLLADNRNFKQKAPYWSDKNILDAVYLPSNENERLFGLMLGAYFAKFTNPSEEDFQLACRLMWNLLTNLNGDKQSKLLTFQRFLNGGEQARLYGNLTDVTKEDTTKLEATLEEIAKSGIYATNDSGKIALLQEIETYMHGRCRLGLLDLNNANSINVNYNRLNVLKKLIDEWIASDENARWIILSRPANEHGIILSMPYILKDSFNVVVKDNDDNDILRQLLSNRNDAKLQLSLIDGNTPEEYRPSEKFLRDWRSTLANMIIKHPDWHNWINGRTIRWHSGLYYLYRYLTAYIKGAWPINDWRSELLEPECWDTLHLLFPDWPKDDLEMNNVNTRSVDVTGTIIPEKNIREKWSISFAHWCIYVRNNGQGGICEDISSNQETACDILGQFVETMKNVFKDDLPEGASTAERVGKAFAR